MVLFLRQESRMVEYEYLNDTNTENDTFIKKFSFLKFSFILIYSIFVLLFK